MVLHDKDGNEAADGAADLGRVSFGKKARIDTSVPNLAWLPGPSTLWTRGLQGWPRIIVSPDDVAGWPDFVSLLVQFGAFLGTLHWR